jgi:hypothetical protein
LAFLLIAPASNRKRFRSVGGADYESGFTHIIDVHSL